VIVARNEAARIGRCLTTLPAGAPVIVYDTGSEDDTAALAEGFGARVMRGQWRGFVTTRRDALAAVTTPWTFMLDADERLTQQLREELLAVDPPASVDGYRVARRNWFCGRWVRGAGWWPDRLVRLFRTSVATLSSPWGDGPWAVHETWSVPGRCCDLSFPLDHDTYPTLASYRRKFAAYTDLEARAARRSVMHCLASWLFVPIRFGWLWLGRRGILDGWRGAFLCAASAAYPAVVASKSLRREGR
jgi:glycosyltransferase involved in cell wall biosynthesis